MKALSLKQPYAELILQGRKKIELRKWNTHFRGDFLIHSSKVPDIEAMKKFGFRNLPCGCIVGKAELIDVNIYKNAKECNSDKNGHLASAEWGHYGFILKNPKRTRKIFCKGSLGFWNFRQDK